MENINIYAELDKASRDRQGNAPIVIRFDLKGKHIGRDPVKIKIPPAAWDENKKEIKSGYPNAVFMNKIIQDKLTVHRQFVFRRQAFELPTDKTIISQYLKLKGGFESFYKHAEDIIATRKMDDGAELSEPSKKRYSLEIKRLMAYQPELSFSQITAHWLQAYKNWMQTVYLIEHTKKRMHKNGIQKALAFVRMIYNEAVERKIILAGTSPFETFRVGKYEIDTSKIKWLETSDIDKIEQALLTKPMQDITRRIGWRFLAMCVSGMRISDAMKLKADFFNDYGDLQFRPHKTTRFGNTAQVPMASGRQQRYFQMTLANPLPDLHSESFRNEFNSHLQILAAHAGVTIHLTSHVGRHTMGGLLVDAGVETRPAMKMLGIKSPKTIETYLHLKQEKLRIEADKLKNIL